MEEQLTLSIPELDRFPTRDREQYDRTIESQQEYFDADHRVLQHELEVRLRKDPGGAAREYAKAAIKLKERHEKELKDRLGGLLRPEPPGGGITRNVGDGNADRSKKPAKEQEFIEPPAQRESSTEQKVHSSVSR